MKSKSSNDIKAIVEKKFIGPMEPRSLTVLSSQTDWTSEEDTAIPDKNQ